MQLSKAQGSQLSSNHMVLITAARRKPTPGALHLAVSRLGSLGSAQSLSYVPLQVLSSPKLCSGRVPYSPHAPCQQAVTHHTHITSRTCHSRRQQAAVMFVVITTHSKRK